MIIIAKNKKNHYMIKKFLTENSEDQYVRTWPAIPASEQADTLEQPIYTDDENTLARESDIENIPKEYKAGIEKLNKLSPFKKLAIPLMTAVLLINAIGPDKSENEDQAIEILHKANPNISKIKVISAIKNNKKEDVRISYETDISEDFLIQKVMDEESFRPTPYPDFKQWSIGYGSRVSQYSDTKNKYSISKSEHNKLRPEYDKLWYKYTHSKSEKEEAKNLKALIDWTNDHIKDWKIDFQKSYNTSDITNDTLDNNQAKNAALVALRKEISRLKDHTRYKRDGDKKYFYYYKYLPANIKLALIDMAYNLGGAFPDKFKKLNTTLAMGAMILANDNLSQSDIEIAQSFFDMATEEIKDSKYARDLSKRADRNIASVKDSDSAFSPEDYEEPLKTFQNESLKRVYSHLFV